MSECKLADYLLLVSGGSVRRLDGYTKHVARVEAATLALNSGDKVMLVEVIGTVEIEARWVDAKEQTK